MSTLDLLIVQGFTELLFTSGPTIENGGIVKELLKLSIILEEISLESHPQEFLKLYIYFSQSSTVPTSRKLKKIYTFRFTVATSQ